MISYSFNLFAANSGPSVGMWPELCIVTGEMKAHRNLIFLEILWGSRLGKKYIYFSLFFSSCQQMEEKMWAHYLKTIWGFLLSTVNQSCSFCAGAAGAVQFAYIYVWVSFLDYSNHLSVFWSCTSSKFLLSKIECVFVGVWCFKWWATIKKN